MSHRSLTISNCRAIATGSVLFLGTALLLLTRPLHAQVRLPQILRDSMVLQRDQPIKLWGWAKAGEQIRLQLSNNSTRVKANANGEWTATLPAMKAGGPYQLNINASNKIVLREILLGDVWICSGQSNMVHQMVLHRELYEDDIARASNTNIRQFWIPSTADLQKPRADLPPAYWKSADPTTVLQFSAVAYYFALDIYQRYKIPIGIINASIGGTPIEAWMSEASLQNFPGIVSKINQNKDTAFVFGTNRAAMQRNATRRRPADAGMTGEVKWFDPAYKPVSWNSYDLPGFWEDQGLRDLDGIVWFRKEIDYPDSLASLPAKVFMGRIVDADAMYINGKQIGTTGYQYPQRRYEVPAGLLKPGKNLLVVRITNNSGKGGFVPDKPYFIRSAKADFDLKGQWQYKVGDVFPREPGGPAGIQLDYQPTGPYNAMIAPTLNYAAKGVLWYQGEANANNGGMYQSLLTSMIADWRASRNLPNLPFIFVQLPNFGDITSLPSESGWATLRDGQLKSLSIPHTAMAITIDLGEWNDIHPMNKKDVGVRLALGARKLVYGEQQLIASGPLFQSASIEADKIIVSFTSTGSGLVSNNGEPLKHFAIAGADKKFVWASATINGAQVIISSPEVPEPRFVRYAWADNPRDANLYNREGLPASPFRTDN